MDAFYASVEVREDPRLKGRPLLVGGTGGRGVVCSASYEARRFGVRSAMSMRTARELCPDAIVVAPRMGLYVRESQRIMTILERFTPLVEPLSLDEAFLDVRGTELLFGTALDVAHAIRADIRNETRLTASVGIASNKFLAKLASDLAKPDGVLEIPDAERVERLRQLPVRMLFGVGRETERRLHALNLHTIGDLQVADEALVRAAVGSFAPHLIALAHGEDSRPIETHRPRHSHGAECTFPRDVTSRDQLEQTLLGFAHEIAFHLRERRLWARTVAIKVRRGDFRTKTRARTLAEPTCLAMDLFRVASDLLCALDPRFPVRLIGLSAQNLVGADEHQGLLFREGGKQERIERGLDRIKKRFGGEAIGPARLLE
jgi:DNA polymerase-4